MHSTFAQGGGPLPKLPSASRPDNPKPKRKYLALAGRPNPAIPSTTKSTVKTKRQEIEQAIVDGNEARDKGQYEQAVASYEKITKELDPKDGRAHYGLGNVYSDLMCTDSAIGEYREALRLSRGSFHDGLIALGYAYANKERYDEAEQQFRKVLSTLPDDPAANIGLATVSAKRKNYAEAIGQLNRSINKRSIEDKDRAAAHLTLGDIYVEQRKWQDAAAEYHKSMNLNPEVATVYMKLGQTELLPAMEQFGTVTIQELRIEDRQRLSTSAKKATKYFRQAIYEHGYNHPYSYVMLAVALEYQFSFREAESNLNTYLAKVKELENQLTSIARTKTCDYGFATLYATGYRFLALLYGQEGLLETDDRKVLELRDKEIESFRQVIRLKEDHPDPYSGLGRIYYVQGKYREAIEQYEKALSRETNEVKKADDYSSLAMAYLDLGNASEALDYLQRAIKIKPDASIYYMQLSSLYQRQGNYDEAILNLQEAMKYEREPTAHSHYFLALVYRLRAREKGTEADEEEAIRLANQAIKINHSYASVYLLLGQIYKTYKGGTMVAESLANYDLALKYDPKNPVIYRGLGSLYFEVLHNDDAAISSLKKAIELQSGYCEAHVELAHVYQHKRDDVEAIKQLQDAIRSNENCRDAYFVLIGIYKKQKAYDVANRYANKLLEMAPRKSYPYKELAKIYEAQQKNEDAIAYYQQAISFLTPDDDFGKQLYLCRIERLRRHYAEAIDCFQKLKPPSSEDPGQQAYDIGLTYVASKDKTAALAQYEKLKQMKSTLAEELLSQINDLK